MNSEIREVSQEEIKARVAFLSSAKCNHTPHKYIDIAGGLIEGTLLSRILYWFSEDKNKRRKVRIFKDGHYWIAKQRKDWQEEIRITERQYDKAIKELKNRGFVELAKYKFNSMPTVHIRPLWENINKAVAVWESELEKEIVYEFQNEANGNNEKCNSQGNDEKCNSGITEGSTSLTLPTNNDYHNNNDYFQEKTEPDFIDNKEKKTLSYTDKDNQTSAPNNYNKLNIYNIPPRTKEQKANRYNSRNQSSLLNYKDEDVENLVTEIYENIYGTKENIFEDHDICLSIFLIKEFFKKYQKYREEKHPMVTQSQAENILKMIRNPDTDMAKDDLVDDKEEPLFYLDMMEEHFKTKWGKRNGGDFDYRIMLFFKDTTQNMLYQRVKQKREDTL